MKNIFRLFSAMLIAGSVMLVSCNPTEEPVPSTPQYTITVSANDPAMGTVTGGGTYDENTTATLTATPNEGYKFVNWNDGNSNNPRVITVTENASYVANFEAISGVNVTFGTNTWSAQYINALISVSRGAFIIAATEGAASTSYPQIQLFMQWEGNPTTGTFTGAPSVDIQEGEASAGNPYLWYFTDSENYINFGGSPAGNWWNKTMTLNITALDVDNLTMSAVANATMGNLLDCIQSSTSWNNAQTQDLTVQIVNQTLTAAKGPIAKNLTAAIR